MEFCNVCHRTANARLTASGCFLVPKVRVVVTAPLPPNLSRSEVAPDQSPCPGPFHSAIQESFRSARVQSPQRSACTLVHGTACAPGLVKHGAARELCAGATVMDPGNEEAWRVGQGPANTLNAGSILPGNQDSSTEKEGKAKSGAGAA